MYRRGAQFEMKMRAKLRAKGYLVVRSAGSHTPIDLVAIHRNHILFVQCKTSNSLKFSLPRILKGKDIQALIRITLGANARKVVRRIVFARHRRTLKQLLWTGKRWKPVRIV